jgi:autophagy-related protein 16
MDGVYQLILERNHRETNPFVAIHSANATLLNQIDALQLKCADLERELVIQKELSNNNDSSGNGARGAVPQSVALKTESKLREKLEKLQEELNDKLKVSAEEQANILELTKETSEMKDLNVAQESTISDLKEEDERKERAIDHMIAELTDAKSRAKLAEQQYMGLKDTIRVLQEENDVVKKENQELATRFVTEKEKMSDEMNKLTEMVEKYKRELLLLKGLKEQEEKRNSWFGLASLGGQRAVEKKEPAEDTRKFGNVTTVAVPSSPKQKVQAHKAEILCVKYDGSGTDLIATGGADANVQVFDTSNGTLKATLRGSAHNSIISCDISNGIIIGGGTDKTCRVWNLRTGRMVNHRMTGCRFDYLI